MNAVLRPGHGSEPPAVVAIAVLPFVVSSDSADEYLAPGMPHLIANWLEGHGQVRAGAYLGAGDLLDTAASIADSADRLFRRFHVERYVTGQVSLLDSTITVRVVLHDAARQGKRLGTVEVVRARDSVFVIARAVARRLLRLEPTASPETPMQGSYQETASKAAFQAFSEGERFFRASQFADAAAAYRRAVQEDTTFGLAHYRLSEALERSTRSVLAATPGSALPPFAERLPWRERSLLEGTLAWREGRREDAEAKYRGVITRDPDYAEAWYHLGRLLFHTDTLRTRPLGEALEPFERVSSLDPRHWGALVYRARLHAQQGDSLAADRLLQAADSVLPGGPPGEAALLRAAIWGRRGDPSTGTP